MNYQFTFVQYIAAVFLFSFTASCSMELPHNMPSTTIELINNTGKNFLLTTEDGLQFGTVTHINESNTYSAPENYWIEYDHGNIKKYLMLRIQDTVNNHCLCKVKIQECKNKAYAFLLLNTGMGFVVTKTAEQKISSTPDIFHTKITLHNKAKDCQIMVQAGKPKA